MVFHQIHIFELPSYMKIIFQNVLSSNYGSCEAITLINNKIC